MSWSQKVLVWVSAFTAVLVVYVEFRAARGFNPFAIWNLLPTAAGVTLLLATGSRRFAVGFGLTASAAVALVHLAWLFNWGEIATSSSTGGLILLFVPVYAVRCRGHRRESRLGDF